MLPIVQTPNEVLSAKAQPVLKIDAGIRELLKQMNDTLLNAKDPEGVGLAAPQVGKSLQIFIIKQSPKHPIETFINPHLTFPHQTDGDVNPRQSALNQQKSKRKKKGLKLEGCLSVKDIWGVVKRYPKISLTYQDETGREHKKTFKGFMSTIIQHEYDHLQGVLFPKHVLEQGNILYKSTIDSKGETVFEELKI